MFFFSFLIDKINCNATYFIMVTFTLNLLKRNLYVGYRAVNHFLREITGVEDEPACAFSDKCSWDIGEPDFDRLGEFDFDYNVYYV